MRLQKEGATEAGGQRCIYDQVIMKDEGPRVLGEVVILVYEGRPKRNGEK